ncbi:MAG: phosphatidate cytidylyltransferase [Flavobacteriaceae bacterium]|nr:phosphatidate cytidylyltransferase [Flavobacteriaceae bacterium]
MRETLIRLVSGIIYVVILIVASSYSLKSFLILFGIFLLISVYEFCSLLNLNKILPIIIAATSYSLFSYFYVSKINEIIILVATIFVSIKCILFLFNDKKQNSNTYLKYLYLIGYIILPFILITKIPLGVRGFNPKIIIGIFILIWTNDTFAYIVGKSIGKHKLFEKISPKKTIEGFIGGILFSVIAGYIISKYYTESTTFIWLVIAIIVGIFGTIGDLVESKFKRIAGVKDSGKIMPGHGGILDRLDSVIFVAPFVFLFYKILNYVS